MQSQGRKLLCVTHCIRTVATGRGEPLHDLDAARRYLVYLPKVDGERSGQNARKPRSHPFWNSQESTLFQPWGSSGAVTSG